MLFVQLPLTDINSAIWPVERAFALLQVIPIACGLKIVKKRLRDRVFAMQQQRALKKRQAGPENSHKASSCVGGAAFSIGRRPHAATTAIIQHKIMRFRSI